MASIAPMMFRRRVLQLGDEGATKGTAAAGDTHVYAFDAAINPDDTFIQRRPVGQTGGNLDGVVGARTGAAKFKVELRSASSTTLNAGVSLLLQAAGFKLATLVYTPSIVEADQKSLTIDMYEDGLLKRLTGGAGNLTMNAEIGGLVYLDCDFKGVWVAPTDVALGTASPAAVVPMRFAASTLTITPTALGAYTPKVSKFSLSLNANVILRPDQSKSSGYSYGLITDVDPTIELDLEADNAATHDAYGLWLAGTNAALSMLLQDATTKATIAGAIQYRTVAEADRDGVLVHNVVAQFVNAANPSVGVPTITIAAV